MTRKIIYTLSALIIVMITGCKKDGNNINIKQHDDDQIQAYIKNNGLTGMQRDTSNGDTSGIYYQIITPGTGNLLEYYDKISLTYRVYNFDDTYNSTDTIVNHVNTYVGYLAPVGLQLGIKFDLKRRGGAIRLLVPSHLAYGVNGITSANTKVLQGNQCLEYFVNIVNDQAAYDDLSIQNYMKRYNLSGFTKTNSGLYYKVTKVGTGTEAVDLYSVVGVQYTGYLLNQTSFDSANNSDGTAAFTTAMSDVVVGWQEGLPKITAGGKITLIMPSALGYGDAGSGTTVPPFSCLRFDINLITVDNP
jgi:FKBP-type peptidyl-prolyl cis-trans isomerase FkpA